MEEEKDPSPPPTKGGFKGKLKKKKKKRTLSRSLKKGSNNSKNRQATPNVDIHPTNDPPLPPAIPTAAALPTQAAARRLTVKDLKQSLKRSMQENVATHTALDRSNKTIARLQKKNANLLDAFNKSRTDANDTKEQAALLQSSLDQAYDDLAYTRRSFDDQIIKRVKHVEDKLEVRLLSIPCPFTSNILDCYLTVFIGTYSATGKEK
jgi:type IV secretory pathway VirB10-like protein